MPVWEEYRQFFCKRSLEGDNVYVGAHGVHFNVRLSDERLCTLVLIRGACGWQKELIAVEDGDRENAESLETVLRDLKRRGMQAPVLAVGDAAAVREVCGLRRANKAMGATRRPSARQAAKRARPCEALTMLRRPQLLTMSLICVTLTAQKVGEADSTRPAQ